MISVIYFFFNDTATTEIYTLSLHDALPIWSIALSSSIPRRTAVAELAACFPFQKGADQTVVGVLLGPGCEGKTTVLLQAAYRLIESNPGWRVLRRVDETRSLPA